MNKHTVPEWPERYMSSVLAAPSLFEESKNIIYFLNLLKLNLCNLIIVRNGSAWVGRKKLVRSEEHFESRSFGLHVLDVKLSEIEKVVMLVFIYL